MNKIEFMLKEETIKNLNTFSVILNKNMDTILEEALENYFQESQQNQNDENAMTNLNYDEFWDGVDID